VRQPSSQKDRVRGRPGDDTIRGGGGFDVLHAGRGADTLWGGAGIDRVRADFADDVAADCEHLQAPDAAPIGRTKVRVMTRHLGYAADMYIGLGTLLIIIILLIIFVF
jgi:hypothetical protein